MSTQLANTPENMELLGFDRTERVGSGHLRLKCSQCEALVINGTPTRERLPKRHARVQGLLRDHPNAPDLVRHVQILSLTSP